MLVMKKIVAQFFYPVGFCLTLLILETIFCLWATRRQRLGKVLVTLSTVLLLLGSSPLYILVVAGSPGGSLYGPLAS